MNGWGIVISFAFVFAVIGIAQVVLKLRLATPAATRKIVHIGVSHWWLIAMACFDSWYYAIVGPVAFVLINIASFVFRLFPAMEHEQRSRNLGTIYFPISLVFLVLLAWTGQVEIWIAGMGVLILGWGDGLASMLGERFGKPRITLFGNRKSILGTATMFVASAVVAFVFLLAFGGSGNTVTMVVASLATAAVATTIEVVTPLGLDNLTVPILTTLFVSAVWS